MQINVGTPDRIIRVILGVALIVLPHIVSHELLEIAAVKWGMVIVGIILMVTALIRFCPLYRLFGIRTFHSADEG